MAVVLIGLAVVAVSRPLLVRLALRNLPRRPGFAALITLGLTLGTIILSTAFTTGDTMSLSVRTVVAGALGTADEVVFVPSADAADRLRPRPVHRQRQPAHRCDQLFPGLGRRPRPAGRRRRPARRRRGGCHPGADRRRERRRRCGPRSAEPGRRSDRRPERDRCTRIRRSPAAVARRSGAGRGLSEQRGGDRAGRWRRRHGAADRPRRAGQPAGARHYQPWQARRWPGCPVRAPCPGAGAARPARRHQPGHAREPRLRCGTTRRFLAAHGQAALGLRGSAGRPARLPRSDPAGGTHRHSVRRQSDLEPGRRQASAARR